MTNKKKSTPVGQTIGGIIVGFDQQIFRTTPPVNELVAKGDRLGAVAASGGGTMRVGMPGDPAGTTGTGATGATGTAAMATDLDLDLDLLRLSAPGVEVVIDLRVGGRIASFAVDGHELLKTAGADAISWGCFPMVPYAGRVRDGAFTFSGRRRRLPTTMPPHAIHGTVLDRRWGFLEDGSIAAELGPDWPFRGLAIQRFELASDRFTCRLELHADEPMPASIGWHPWFVRQVTGAEGTLELDLDAGAMYVRDAAGIATTRTTPPTPGPWDDCFTDLRRPPVLRWPGLLELTIESDCPDWVVYTSPDDALCVEPQTAPPDAINTDPTVIHPGRPLIAEMTWRWRSLAD